MSSIGISDRTMFDVSTLKIIDWNEASSQVGNDSEFLSEVLNDLMMEATSARDDIRDGIKNQDYITVSKSAHRFIT